MTPGNRQLRAMVETAVRNTFERRKDVIYELLCEAVEDVGLVNAIRAGSRTRAVSRQTIDNLLKRRG